MRTRCKQCGASEEKPCGHTEGTVKIETRDFRRFCRHEWKRVYGVPTWRNLCVKCGSMTR